MPEYFWDEDKNTLLQQTRGVGFEDVVSAIKLGNSLTDIAHPNAIRYPNQRLFILAGNITKNIIRSKMKKVKFDAFKNLVLDEYEQEIEDSLPDNPEIKPISPKRLKELQKAAELTLARIKKTKNINLRLSEDTVSNLKIRAEQLALRYQTLAGSVLHRYASGQTIIANSL